ncbi:MAG: sialidase family protein [Kiritimatiellae bacterium]|jgi:sialidase-1|nr:sialidase family protein [Kiritimatiellia bacterium]
MLFRVYGLLLSLACGCALFAGAQEVPVRVLELPPGPDNPRNSEGTFITLKDGRILYLYTHFTGKSGGDHAPAYLAARSSSDSGRTWTKEDRVVVRNEGAMNIMETHLLRLRGGEIALLYLVKNSTRDCRPVIRFSSDECETWSAPEHIITDKVGYYPGNNDRVIQMKSGRLVLPTHDASFTGGMLCYLSDDEGRSWRRNAGGPVNGFNAAGKKIVTQEPGVVELKDGRLMMFIRTDQGCQYLSWSEDGGETWSKPGPSQLFSPRSPASIKRIPSTGDLLLVWNDHTDIPLTLSLHGRPQGTRVPLSTAISKDDGKTWQNVKRLEGNPNGWYCYIAIEFAGDSVLLGYCAMGANAHSRITRVPVSWLYADTPPKVTAPAIKTLPTFHWGNIATGAFERVEVKEGTSKTVQAVWTAEPGHAEVYVYTSRRLSGKYVRLLGGKDRTVTLTLQNPIFCRNAMFGAERFTRNGTYSLIMEAKVDGDWRKIGEQDTDLPGLKPFLIDCSKSDGKASEFRFRCTSLMGAIIAEMPDYSLNGFFND